MHRKTFLVLLLSWTASATYGADAQPVKFALPDRNGKMFFSTVISAQGPFIMSFWATYCSPCQAEIQFLKSAKLPFPVYYVNVDHPSQYQLVLRTASDWDIPDPILFDQYQIVIRKYSPDIRIPGSYLIGSDLAVKLFVIGGDENALRSFTSGVREYR